MKPKGCGPLNGYDMRSTGLLIGINYLNIQLDVLSFSFRIKTKKVIKLMMKFSKRYAKSGNFFGCQILVSNDGICMLKDVRANIF